MMTKKNGLIVLCALVVILSVICINQYGKIQKSKIQNLNTAFYYMQEIIDDESQRDFPDWEKKASRLYVLVDYVLEDKHMGDYDEIKNMIDEVSKIENPKSKDAQSLLRTAKEMRVSWYTGFGKWKAEIE